MKLDDIERLAKAAERIRPPEPPAYNYRAYIDPRAVLALIACVRAADAVRTSWTTVPSEMTVEENNYDRARAALDQ